MSSALPVVLAYCGAPPSPAEIWHRWRFDPVVLALLAAWLAAYLRGARVLRASGAGVRAPSVAFVAGWAVAAFVLISPLCALSVSLFAARATQHVVLTLLAAPLIAAGGGMRVTLAGLGVRVVPPAARAAHPLLAAGAFAAAIWFWHAPAAYAATFASVAAYWMMHATLFASACWLWSTLLRRDDALVGGLLASLISSAQEGLLGALLTLSPRPVYAPHFLTTDAWGLTALQDQQLGGAIMWVPGCAVFLVVALIALRSGLARARPRRLSEAAAS
ncbi:MAG TPA: cytochrome c oxidase assembly protein [Dokdonella sp.]